MLLPDGENFLEVIGMGRRPILSDDMIQVRLDEHEKLQYRLILHTPNPKSVLSGLPYSLWEAEIVGPHGSPHYGTTAFGSDKSRAVSNLIGQLGRKGFIGRLVEITGRGPHTDLVDHDPLAD